MLKNVNNEDLPAAGAKTSAGIETTGSELAGTLLPAVGAVDDVMSYRCRVFKRRIWLLQNPRAEAYVPSHETMRCRLKWVGDCPVK